MFLPSAKGGNVEDGPVTPGCVLILGCPPKQNTGISCKFSRQENE